MDAVDGGDAPGAESDSSLMARFYACSEDAFETLSERWWPRLFTYFRKRGFGQEDAEDLVVESLLRLYVTKERQTFDTSQQLAPFLFKLAHNLAIAAWRKRRKWGNVGSLEDCLQLVAGEREPDMVSDLLGCVWQLPELESTYVALCGRHGLGELSHGDIARILGKWPPQITQISKRALVALKRCMTLKGYR